MVTYKSESKGMSYATPAAQWQAQQPYIINFSYYDYFYYLLIHSFQ